MIFLYTCIQLDVICNQKSRPLLAIKENAGLKHWHIQKLESCFTQSGKTTHVLDKDRHAHILILSVGDKNDYSC